MPRLIYVKHRQWKARTPFKYKMPKYPSAILDLFLELPPRAFRIDSPQVLTTKDNKPVKITLYGNKTISLQVLEIKNIGISTSFVMITPTKKIEVSSEEYEDIEILVN